MVGVPRAEGAWGGSRIGPTAHLHCIYRPPPACTGHTSHQPDPRRTHWTCIACTGPPPPRHAPDPRPAHQTHASCPRPASPRITRIDPAPQAPDPYRVRRTRTARLGRTARSPDPQCTRRTLPACTRPASHAPEPPCMHQTHICSVRHPSRHHGALQEPEPLCN